MAKQKKLYVNVETKKTVDKEILQVVTVDHAKPKKFTYIIFK